MRAAMIENGVVMNVIEVESLDALEGVTLIDAPSASIGDAYHAVSGEFTRPEVVEPAPTEAQIVAGYEKALDDHIDTTAKAYGYMSIITAVSYAEEPAVPKFQQEGQAFRAWRSLCYAYGHEVMAAVKAGERAAPSYADLIAELPDLGLPEPA